MLDSQVILGYVYNAVTMDGLFGLMTKSSATFDDVILKTNDAAFASEGDNLVRIGSKINWQFTS